MIGQSLDGKVVGEDGPLPYAIVTATIDGKIVFHTETDEGGNFNVVLNGTPSFMLGVHLLGKKQYSKQINKEDFNKPILIKLETDVYKQKPVVVYTSNPISQNGLLRIKRSDFLKMAASFDDPTRLLMKQQAFSTTNDQANSISFRAMPSHYYSWRLNGAEILNPNHLSNAGTVSDLGSVSAGGVNMFSGQAISGYIFNGPTSTKNNFNSLSGSSNILSGYDDEKSIQFSLLGLEAAYGFDNLGKGWKLKANYRYSFTGLLGLMGVDFGGETINFQDVFVTAEQVNDKTTTKIVVDLGNSSNVFTHFEEPTTLKEYADIDFKSNIAVVNLFHERNVKPGTIGLNTAYSSRGDDRDYNSTISPSFPLEGRISSSEIKSQKVFLNPYFKTKKYFSFGTRFIFDNAEFTIIDNLNQGFNLDDKEINNLQILPYISFQKFLKKGFYIEADASLQYDSYSSSTTLTPHVNLRYEINKSLAATVRTGINAQSQPAYAMTFSEELLKPTVGHFAELELKITLPTGNTSIQTWYSNFSQVPINNQGISLFNNLDYIPLGNLSSDGEASSKGVSIISEFSNNRGWWTNVNASFFDAKYSVGDISYDAQNNFGQIYNVSLGKSFSLKNKKVMSISSSFHYRNGAPYFGTINSRVASYSYEGGPSGVLGTYSRLDLRISYEKRHSVWSLDIQNVMNKENEAYLYYDPLTDSTKKQLQLGLIPILSYKYKFK